MSSHKIHLPFTALCPSGQVSTQSFISKSCGDTHDVQEVVNPFPHVTHGETQATHLLDIPIIFIIKNS